METDEQVTNLGETNVDRTITQKKYNDNTCGDSRKYFGGAQPNQEHYKRGIIREAHGNPKINTPPARGGNEVGKRSK
ncbi:hypothetical protein P8452_63863 [Trifolium repens]|nr:hypothetical protein P8452_63863 [Trifolium repens]